MGREEQVSLEAIIQIKMKSSCKEGEATKKIGKTRRTRGWEKAIRVCRWCRLQKEQVERRVELGKWEK